MAESVAPLEKPRCAGAAAFVGASGFAMLLVTIGLAPAAFALGSVFALILLVVPLVAFAIGGPLYLLAAAARRVNGWTASAAGFGTGALLPALVLLPLPPHGAFRGGAVIAAFGFCGAAAGLVFLFLRGPVRGRAALGAAVLGLTGLSGASAWIAQDHSCHNPVWWGRGIASSAQFRIKIPANRWREVAAELTAFARDHGWSVRTQSAYEPRSPWFGVSVCRSDGTDLVISSTGDEGAFEASVFQPQGGESWKEPMRDLLSRVQRRWPRAIEYYGERGEPTAHQPGWVRASLAAPSGRAPASPAPPP